MSESLVKKSGTCWIIAKDELKDDVTAEWFDDKFWLNNGRLLGASSGRGSAWMVKSGNTKMMLRHYYRGGVPAKFNKDKYFWSSLDKTRSFKEFRLLQKLQQLELPTPQPVAAQSCKKGLFYQANILIEYIPNTQVFSQLLNTDSNIEIWNSIGKTIALFHQKNVYHADLNAHNILIENETNKIYLIDFDNCSIKNPKKSWQKANLKRLKRSIDKLTDESHQTENHKKWKSLKQSYFSALNVS
ncbi:MAG: 3-deoxy-D-manno-octulosonic acid kinase [Gammaproteobacteria bacterium]